MGAGDLYYPDPVAGPWVGFDEVDGPPGAEGVVALRVRGDSMAPVFNDGDLVFIAHPDGSPPDSAVGKNCIVQIRNGPAYLKRLEPGKNGLFTLVSYSQKTEPIRNADVEWAAPVLWIKPR